jgi:hypothetical protein
VSSLDSDHQKPSSDPVVVGDFYRATKRALDRSRIEYTQWDPNYNSMPHSKSTIIFAVLAMMQFNRTRELEDLKESIDALVKLCDSDAAAQPDCHHATAQAFLNRFDITRNIEDLNRACHYLECELHLHPDAALERVEVLSNLGTVLSTRFSLLGGKGRS